MGSIVRIENYQDLITQDIHEKCCLMSHILVLGWDEEGLETFMHSNLTKLDIIYLLDRCMSVLDKLCKDDKPACE